MPSIESQNNPSVRKLSPSRILAFDVSIDDEYHTNFEYLQNCKKKSQLAQYKSSASNELNSSRTPKNIVQHDLLLKDPAIESVVNGNSNCCTPYFNKVHSSENIRSIPTEKPSFNSSSSVNSKKSLNAPEEILTPPLIAPNKCDTHFSNMHDNNIIANFTRSASIYSPQNNLLNSAKLSRGRTLASFDTNKPTNMQSGSESCYHCEKRVYPLDRLSTGDRVYHKSCFRCNECNRTLSATNFAKLEGLIFCKPHYIEKFRRRGKYEAVIKPGSSSCSMTPILNNGSNASSKVSAEQAAATE